MAKVNNLKTSQEGAQPSAEKAADHDVEQLPDDVVIDSLGRRLVIGARDIVTESRIIRALGESAMNTAYVAGYVNPAMMVLSIDGEKCPAPKTMLEIEARIQLVGREGITAIMHKLLADAERLRELSDEQQGEDQEVAEVKK
ncbi:hypothetical protein [Herbaspirillum frisingense]|uniref:hypothetical protein n=1 Tax=Herbaspirillum frisingense TaxID=92645 RepID=UPI0039AFA06D